jgi:hypothetical protein
MITFSNLGKYGRLGNQLFQISTVYSHATRNGYDYILPEWKYNTFLKSPLPTSEQVYNLYKFRERDAFSYEKIIGDNLDLVGYFQNENYFSDLKKEILNILTPKDEYKKNAASCLPDGRLTSLHIRRGDYLGLQNHHPVVSLDYYSQAIEFLRDSTDYYVVFSDDIEWCKNNFPDSFIFSDNDDEFIDLLKMSLCHNHIIANSSFSWWGSYLSTNDGKVIAPNKWVGPAYNKTGWQGVYRKEMIKF